MTTRVHYELLQDPRRSENIPLRDMEFAVPFAMQELRSAREAYLKFLSQPPPEHHARYIFPFFAGSYFAYRKIDVLRVSTVARSIRQDPSYLDFGCGYGDFLSKVREYLPKARGIEKEGVIFYAFGFAKPEYIDAIPVESFAGQVDVAFVGWMEPGVDFRNTVARSAKCVITTFDAGGQCGIAGGCEYDQFGFVRVARWRTPSWIDVNAELMNRYYTPSLDSQAKARLASLRTSHNFWYVYSRPEFAEKIRTALHSQIMQENQQDAYDFESVLEECGFGYKEELATLSMDRVLWEVTFA